MNLAFRFLLSPESTSANNQHTIRPYAHWFSHQRSNDSLFRHIAFPDVVPRLTRTFHLAESDFLSLAKPSRSAHDSARSFWSTGVTDSQGYDYVVTLFFIDTSLDVLTTMAQIYNLLRPGGTWINLGPLLWTSGGQAKVELSLEEVLAAAEDTGFFVEQPDCDDEVLRRRTVECEYTGDPNAMMRWIYKAEFWVAHKPK